MMKTIVKGMGLVAVIFAVGCGSDPASGVNGSRGPAGADGVAGVAGPAGAKGADGAQGPAGAKGEPGKDASGGTVSGSRLHAQYLAGLDGSRVWIGMLDSDLGVQCAYGVATDGKTRCLPPKATSTIEGFADSACAVPFVVAVAPSGQTPPDPPAYERVLHAGAADEYFKVGVAMPTPSPFYTLSGGVCVADPGGGQSQFFFYSATVAPAATFAEGTVTTD